MSLVIKIYDLASNELADISGIALDPSMSAPSLSTATSFVVKCPAGDSLLTSVVAGDGLPNLRKGCRKLLVWEDTVILYHGRIFTVERDGDGEENLVTITAQTPLAEMGYEGNDQAGRPVRGSTTQPTAGTPYGEYDGNFIDPLFASSVTSQAGISGPDLILQVLTNSENTGAESDPSPGEGPHPIDLTLGTFDLDVPDAVDLSAVETMDWPALIGDFIQQLCETGVCDVYETPLDIGDVADTYKMVSLSAVSASGTDRSGGGSPVHFDYFTGSKNALKCKHVEDFSTINNKLYDYLGPAVGITKERWTTNITPSIAPTDLATAITASRTLYGGQFMSIRIFDSIGGESDSRPLYDALWIAEQGDRVEPRSLLYMTPAPGAKGLFTAPQDFDKGDIIGLNVGSEFGLALAETQRVYGYTISWDRQGVKSLSQLVTSADEA